MSNTILLILQIMAVLAVIGVIVNIVSRIKNKKTVVGTIYTTAIGVMIILALVCFTSYLSDTSSKVISCVKEGCPAGCEITYGQAIDNFLSDAEWEYFKSDSSPYNIVVEVNGDCVYNENQAKMKIQFSYDSDILQADQVTEESEFYINYVGRNGETCSEEEANAFVNTIFSSYAQSNDLQYDERYFFDESEDETEMDSSDTIETDEDDEVWEE